MLACVCVAVSPSIGRIYKMDKIHELSKYYGWMIDTIPLEIYFNQDDNMMDNIKTKRTLQNEEGLSFKAKAKRLKLDASSHMKVSDAVLAFTDKKKEDKKMKELKKKLHKKIQELKQTRGGGTTQEIKTEMPQTPKRTESAKKEHKTPQIFNAEGDLVFSKFDLASNGEAFQTNSAKPEKKKSLKGLFEKAKKAQDKLTKLEKIDTNAAHKIKEKKIWENALLKSEGNKVRDDPKLLEKKIKRKTKAKVKSAKNWQERKDKVEQRMNKKQERRQSNLNKRKDAKKGKKIKLLKKKGRIL